MLWSLVFLVLISSIGIVEPSKKFRWCTIKYKERAKCADFVKGLQVVSKLTDVAIDPSCVEGKDDVDCMKKIKESEADFIALDSGKVYTAGKDYRLVPIAYEESDKGNKGYYAVAVAKNDTSVTLKTLKEKKTCHTGYRETSGWNMPVGYFLNYMESDFRQCGDPSDAASASKYFDQSCAPGAPAGFGNLCALCKSKTCDKKDDYAGYSGAFKCMKDGGGDVAFVNHLTTAEVVGSNMTKDYKYLCTDGSSKVVTADSHVKCNFAFSPSHTVVARSGDNFDYVKILTTAAEYCQGSTASSKCGNFTMFSSSKYGGKDLLFKDSTKKLLSVEDKNTYQKWLGEYSDSLDALYKFEPCPVPVSTSVTFTPYYCPIIVVFALIKSML